MPNYSKKIVYLSKEQYQELLTNNSVTVNGVTVTYNENDLYVTPQTEPITDVKINNTSIGSNGIVNIPIGRNKLGALYVDSNGSYGVCVNSTDGRLLINAATQSVIKSGSEGYKPIVAAHQHESIYYALAKLAGADMTSVTGETIGVYPEAQKAAIQNMLGITDLISTEEFSTATAAHTINSTFMMNGKLHRATAAIAIGDAVEVGTNCEVIKADEVFVKNTEYATSSRLGLVKVNIGYGITVDSVDRGMSIIKATSSDIKSGTHLYKPIVPSSQHESVYYGLSRLAGVNLASETVTVGTYPETSKTAIRSLIGATSSNIVAVQDTQPTETDNKIWMLETPPEGVEVPTYAEFQALDAAVVKKTDIASQTNAGIIKINASFGLAINANSFTYINRATSAEVKEGTNVYKPITPVTQHEAAFYGLAKAAGDSTQAASDNAVGTYTADASTAIRTMLGAVGTADYATAQTAGVAKVDSTYGIDIGTTNQHVGFLRIHPATDSELKGGSVYYTPLTVANQHKAVFYGLSKLAGVDLASETVTFGTYPNTSKTAIQSMLGIEANIPLIETVSGTTPSITGMPNVRYICGEVSTISITPPASGSIVVRFESGSTATTMTVPSTVKWPAWFDATALDTNVIYEVIITDGVYGSVMTWAN